MDDQTSARFLARLWGCQREAGLSANALARALACDPSYVSLLRSGRRKRPGLRFAMNAVRRFPELAVFLLPADLPVSHTDVPIVNEDVA